MKLNRLAAGPLLLGGLLICSAAGSANADDKSAKVISVAITDCNATRPAHISSETSTLSIIFSGPPKDKLVKKGVLEANGQKLNVYLPKSKELTVKNSAKTDDSFSNTSTVLSIDQDGDGKLTQDESWFSNLPIRIGDEMFECVDIAKDGSRIDFRPSPVKLQGVVLGRKCPDFSLKTMDGKKVERKDFSGKALILDIWSVT